MSTSSYRIFKLELGDEVFTAKYGLFINRVLHLELHSDSEKAFFSETGFRSQFFGMVQKERLEEVKKEISSMNDLDMLEIVKQLHPNYPKTKNRRAVQLTLF